MVWKFIAALAAVATALTSRTVEASASAPIIITDLHDPTMTKYGTSTYCAFGTGLSETTAAPGGIRVKKLSSSSLTSGGTWEDAGTIAVPSWVTSKYPAAVNVWAPEIYKDASTSIYYMYYAVSGFGTQVSAIGVASSSTPCTASSWVDHGIIVSSKAGSTYNAIDPNVFLDENDQLWLSFGSFFGGIAQVKLSSPTTAVSSTATIYNIAKRSGTDAEEASSIVYHGGYYFLFTSFDACCEGTSSTYSTHVGRSTSPYGPFVDEDGVEMVSGGGTSFLAKTGDYIGPGGGDVYVEGSTWWYIFHYYDGANSGAVTTALQAISWSSGKWPRSLAKKLSRAERELLAAARKGDLRELEELLEDEFSHGDVDVYDENDWTPLMWAACHGHEHVIALLLANGAQTNARNTDNATALMLAAERDKEDILTELLDNGAHIDLRDSNGATAFMKAAQRGHVHAVRRLHEAGAHINLKDDDGDSALMLAVVRNNAKVVKALLAMRPLVNEVDKHGESVLMVAALKGRIATVQMLLDADADVNAVNSKGWTSLMIAAMNNPIGTVRALLDAGADNSPLCFEAQKSALDYARDYGRKGVIRMLKGKEDQLMLEQGDEMKEQLVLFFDGGCRGNPGPGASGWVLVQVHPHEYNAHRILLFGCAALSDARTTNNIAEYRALMLGLKAVLAHGYKDIHVAGDSANIVRQMEKDQEPWTEHLKEFFNASRWHAEQIGIFSWTHLGRKYNSMADAIVNWSMDTQNSVEVHDPDKQDGVGRVIGSHLENDVNEWLRRNDLDVM